MPVANERIVILWAKELEYVAYDSFSRFDDKFTPYMYVQYVLLCKGEIPIHQNEGQTI